MARDVVATRTAKFAKPGTRKRLTAMEAKAVVALGQATYYVEPTAATAEAPAARVPKRAYNRRDMVAQQQLGATAYLPPSQYVTKTDDGEAA